MPQRLAQLQVWLKDVCAFSEYAIEPVSGDASFRRYFRVRTVQGASLIAMDAPPEREDSAPFVDVTQRLQAAGVHVPTIHAADLTQGFLLLEDLGDALYLPALNDHSVDALYGEAMRALLQFQRAGDSAGLPVYDRALLAREMALFPEWLLGKHLGISMSPAQQSSLDACFESLIGNALAQPQVLVHRDYHSRNLLLCDLDSPGIIDYQDAVLGPLTYDLVSLLRDCYVRWPRERVVEWRDSYAHEAVQAGLMDEQQRESFAAWFDLMGVQRHLKAAGIFARLWHRDGKSGYLADIPRTLGYIVELADDYPELQALIEVISQQVLPRLSDR